MIKLRKINLSEYLTTNVLLIPVLSNKNFLYNIQGSQLSCIYVKSLDTGEQCVLGFGHSDLDVCDYTEFISEIQKSSSTFYVKNLRYIDIWKDNFFDLDVCTWLVLGNADNQGFEFERFQKWYNGYSEINSIIPIMNHVKDYFKKVVALHAPYMNSVLSMPKNSKLLYANTYAKVLFDLETAGINCNAQIVKQRYDIDYFDNDGYIHPRYNSLAVTGRPSALYNKINFQSLNKSDNTRSMVIPRVQNGMLVMFDYDAYHVRILADMCGYVFPESNIHEHLGKQYFGLSSLNPEQYENSKRITFQQMYGDVDTTYAYVEFFKVVANFKNKLFETFETTGEIITPGGKKFTRENIVNPTKGKVFAYYQQAVETETNIPTLAKIQQYLYTRKSKLILYMYDAFVIDFDTSDGEYVLPELKNIIEQSGYPCKVSFGYNFGEMIAAA